MCISLCMILLTGDRMIAGGTCFHQTEILLEILLFPLIIGYFRMNILVPCVRYSSSLLQYTM